MLDGTKTGHCLATVSKDVLHISQSSAAVYSLLGLLMKMFEN